MSNTENTQSGLWDRFKKWINCGSCIRASLTAVKGLLIASGPTFIATMQALGYPTSDVEKGIAAAVTLLGLVLTVMEQTAAALVKATKDIEGVQVHVDTKSPETPVSVVKLAEGPTPDVFPMVGGPRQPSDHDDVKTSG